MERKIGEIFEFGGEWYQCVKSSDCPKCDLKHLHNCNHHLHCSTLTRKDGEEVIFKKFEKVGEPVTVKGRTFQKLTSDNNSCKECVFNVPNKGCCKNSYIEGICDDNGFWIEIKQNKEDMEENNNAKHSNSEKIGKNLKEFNLEAAKSGKPVCTRDGRKARIICFDRDGDRPIIALITNIGREEVESYHSNGQITRIPGCKDDLMMLPEKKEGWVNVYKETSGEYYMDKIIHKTEKFAFDVACPDNYIGTVKIEWYE